MKRTFRIVALAAALAASGNVLGQTALSQAQGFINQGQYEQALSVLDAHLQQSPQDAEARFTRGLVLVKLGREDDALKTFSNLTRDYPQLPEPYNNLAVLYAQRGDYEKARDALEAALATHPSYATAHENLGDIYAALASAAYNRALMLDQNNPAIRHKLRLMEQINMPQGVATETVVPETLPAPEPAAAAATPAPAPVPAPEAVPELAAETAEAISQAIYDWSGAWSEQNVPAYLAAYTADFRPDDGLSHSQWEVQRRERVSAPSRIAVRVLNPQIELLSPGHARVTFVQTYESDNYSDRVRKLLELRETDSGWQISRETTL